MSNTELARHALTTLSERAQGALKKMLTSVPTAAEIGAMPDWEARATYQAIQERWWMVADRYGTLASALGQGQAQGMITSIDAPLPELRTPEGIREPGVTGFKFTDAMSEDDWLGSALAALDGHIQTANTSAILDAASDAKVGVYWRTSGTDSCRYCLDRAAYGFYTDFYSEAQRQGFMTRPHDDCRCRPEIVTRDGVDHGYLSSIRAEVARRDRDERDRALDRRLSGRAKPGPKTGHRRDRDRSPEAWQARQRIKNQRDAAKRKLKTALQSGDKQAEAEARAVLKRTAIERDRLNGIVR